MLAIPPEAIAAALQAQPGAGASERAVALALAVAWPESGYNSDARGDWMRAGRLVDRGAAGAVPTSFGYTQLHNADGGDGGGLGNGYTAEQLVDPVLNFELAERAIEARLQAGASDLEAIRAWSTRATAVGLVDDTLAALGGAGAVAAQPPPTSQPAPDVVAGPRPLVLVGVAALVLWALGEL